MGPGPLPLMGASATRQASWTSAPRQAARRPLVGPGIAAAAAECAGVHKGRHKQPRSAQPLPPPLADADGYNPRPNPLALPRSLT